MRALICISYIYCVFQKNIFIVYFKKILQEIIFKKLYFIVNVKIIFYYQCNLKIWKIIFEMYIRIAIIIKIIIWINNFNYYVSNYIWNSHLFTVLKQLFFLLAYCIPFCAHKRPISLRKYSCIQRASLHEHSLFPPSRIDHDNKRIVDGILR